MSLPPKHYSLAQVAAGKHPNIKPRTAQEVATLKKSTGGRFASRQDLMAKVEALQAELDQAKSGAVSPAVSARSLETVAKQTAKELSAARRSVPASTAPKASAPTTVTAAEFEKAAPRMLRSEFQKLSPQAKSDFCKSNGKIIQ
jgi:hypothetical protein